MIELTLKQLSQITAIPTADLEELLNGEGGVPLENAPEIIVKKVGDRIKENTNQQFKAATSKIATKLENIVKGAGIEEFEGVEDAVQKLAQKASEQGEGNKSVDLDTLKITDLAKIPAFQTYRDAKDAEVTSLKAEIENTVKSVERRETAVKARTHAFSYLDTKLAKYTDKDMQLDAIFNFIPVDRLKWDEKQKDFVVLGTDGEPELDGSANPVKFLDALSDKWGRLYGFNETDPNKKTPAPKATFSKDKQQQPQGITFESRDAAEKAVRNEVDVKRRLELRKAMNEQFPVE